MDHTKNVRDNDKMTNDKRRAQGESEARLLFHTFLFHDAQFHLIHADDISGLNV